MLLSPRTSGPPKFSTWMARIILSGSYWPWRAAPSQQFGVAWPPTNLLEADVETGATCVEVSVIFELVEAKTKTWKQNVELGLEIVNYLKKNEEEDGTNFSRIFDKVHEDNLTGG